MVTITRTQCNKVTPIMQFVLKICSIQSSGGMRKLTVPVNGLTLEEMSNIEVSLFQSLILDLLFLNFLRPNMEANLNYQDEYVSPQSTNINKRGIYVQLNAGGTP